MRTSLNIVKIPKNCDSLFQILLTDEFLFVYAPSLFDNNTSIEMSKLLISENEKRYANRETFQEYSLICPLPEILNLSKVIYNTAIDRNPPSILITGDKGSGKSTVFKLFYKYYHCCHSKISVSSNISIYDIIDTIKSSCIKNGDNLTSWNNEKIHILIDDINYFYDSSPLSTNIDNELSELFRHIIQYNLIVDYKSLKLLNLKNIMLSYTTNNYYLDKLSLRLLHHFKIVYY